MRLNSQVSRCLITIGLGIVISTACLGQASVSRSVNQKGAKNEARPLTEIERRGLENLDRIALEARQIDNAAIRTELQSLIGDALWEFDKSTARNIFLDAFKNARAITDKRDDAGQRQTAAHAQFEWRGCGPV